MVIETLNKKGEPELIDSLPEGVIFIRIGKVNFQLQQQGDDLIVSTLSRIEIQVQKFNSIKIKG